jgi:hypothetical protein
MVTTALVGVTAHVRAYVRDHRHLAPGLIFAAGFSLVLCARLWLEGRPAGPYAVVLGGLFTASSHYANRWCRCCSGCGLR